MASYLLSRMNALTETIWLARAVVLGIPKLLEYQHLVVRVGGEMCVSIEFDRPMTNRYVSLLLEPLACVCQFVLSEYGIMSQVDDSLSETIAESAP